MVEAVEKGLHPEDAALAFSCGRSTVFGWLARFQAGGRAAEAFRKQLAQLRRWIVGRDPRQLGLDFTLWTRELVGSVIMRKSGVSYTPKASGSCCEGWAVPAAPAGACLGAGLAQDRAGVRADCHAGAAWEEVGRAPVVQSAHNRRGRTATR